MSDLYEGVIIKYILCICVLIEKTFFISYIVIVVYICLEFTVQ